MKTAGRFEYAFMSIAAIGLMSTLGYSDDGVGAQEGNQTVAVGWEHSNIE